jgi:hypothetical protein
VFRTLAILFISLSAAATAQAGPTLEHLLSMSGKDAILLDTDWDVVVAEVRSVDGGATNGNPPRLDLAVLRVLRGGAQVDRRRAVWEPFPNDIDWIGGGAEEAIARWEADSLSGPPVGSKYILVGETLRDSIGTVFHISALGRFPFDDKREASVRAALERVSILRTEQAEYANAWLQPVGEKDLLDGARPVLPSTALEVGQPILIQWAMLWQGRVVRVNVDGTVVVRPEGHDSRWDKAEKREGLLLYPERLLSNERTRAGR